MGSFDIDSVWGKDDFFRGSLTSLLFSDIAVYASNQKDVDRFISLMRKLSSVRPSTFVYHAPPKKPVLRAPRTPEEIKEVEELRKKIAEMKKLKVPTKYL